MIDVVLLPAQIPSERLEQCQVVVLDVLRATSTIVTALSNGAREVHLFGDLESAREARVEARQPALLGGERGCLKVEGFDLGNSPGEYVTEKIGGATVLLSTTNGTVAAEAVRGARQVFVGSLLNATATATALLARMAFVDTMLVCAGTEGRTSMEDVVGAGAILWQIMQQVRSPSLPFGDTAWMAYQTFAAVRHYLPAALRLGQGGINLIEAGLEEDIDRCAKLDSRPIVVRLEREPLRAVIGE